MTCDAFEKWISSDPYNRLIAKHGDCGTWPGQYKSYATQLAWEAWQEAARQERQAIIAEMPGGHYVDPQWVCDMIRARGAK